MEKKKLKKQFKNKIEVPTNKFTIPRRAVWFLMRTLLIIMVIVSLAFFAFLTSMRAANIYIIVTEGITLRAHCILGQNDPAEMKQYFTAECINSDKMLQNNVYEDYDITGVDYRLSVEGMNVWPWKKTASMTVMERIPSITGSALETAPSASVPEWETVWYNVICMKENNRWYITEIAETEGEVKEEPRATPDMHLPVITVPPEATTAPVTEAPSKSDETSSEETP